MGRGQAFLDSEPEERDNSIASMEAPAIALLVVTVAFDQLREETLVRGRSVIEDYLNSLGSDRSEFMAISGSMPGLSIVIAAVTFANHDLAREIVGLPDLTTTVPLAISRARLKASCALVVGDPSAARQSSEAAVSFCSAVRCRPELSLSRLELAELLLEHYPDEHDAAIEHLDFAIAELRDMKMQPALERALRHRGLLKA